VWVLFFYHPLILLSLGRVEWLSIVFDRWYDVLPCSNEKRHLGGGGKDPVGYEKSCPRLGSPLISVFLIKTER